MAQKLQTRKRKQAVYYDRGANELHPLAKGDVVRVLSLPGQSKWFRTQVKDQVTIRYCNVRTEDGRVHRQNRSHLSKIPEKYQAMSDDEAVQSERTSWTPIPPLSCKVVVPTESLVPQIPDASMTAVGSQTDSQSVSSNTPVHTRSGRIVKRPGYLDDFIVRTVNISYSFVR